MILKRFNALSAASTNSFFSASTGLITASATLVAAAPPATRALVAIGANAAAAVPAVGAAAAAARPPVATIMMPVTVGTRTPRTAWVLVGSLLPS